LEHLFCYITIIMMMMVIKPRISRSTHALHDQTSARHAFASYGHSPGA
jgi:hypothetical protein